MYPYQTAQNTLLKVNGIEGARAYQMLPNQTIALFDATQDLFYVKSSDAGGFATIKAFKFEPVENVENSNFVTRNEFEKLKEEISNAIKSIQQSTNKSANNKSSKVIDG